jgi:hypothetical protein
MESRALPVGFCRHCGRPIHQAWIHHHNEWVHSQLYAWILCPGRRAEPSPKHPSVVGKPDEVVESA